MTQKFRAWDKENKKMLVVNDICNLFWENTFFECYELVPDPKGKREYELINHRIDFEDCVLMQSTGLFDKNGKEIFEGDIIVAMSQGVKAIGEVKRRIDGYWLMYPSWQHGELWHIVENVDTGETGVEIIGNIYENPELVDELE
ncbi:YopX family protein [Streptococcus suis]|uniref:YopX family protein n=1 Tax=Streptococcus suis TaxID=1307 RepID=UPI000CF39596|nr:YopX family protein [Streptococcus suis]